MEADDFPFYYPVDSECIKYMPGILAELKMLLPQRCIVKHALMALGSDGQLYDIAELNNETLALVDKALEESYIVIDW